MKPKKAKKAQAKPQKPLSLATMHALSQLNLAEKAVMECNRIGLVVRHVFWHRCRLSPYDTTH